MSLLGIDVGTTGCKAAVFSVDGKLLKDAYAEYDILQPRPGWAELDAAAVWETIKQTIAAAASGSGSDPVQSLCVSSLGEAVVPVTADRRILGPSLLNADARGEEYLERLGGRISDAELYAVNGNTLGNHYTLTKLLWMRDHAADLYGRAYKFLHWGAFVSFMLGADPVVDFSLANRTLLFDLNAEDWSDELLGRTGLDRDKLPDAAPSGTAIGRISRHMADELGLPADATIVTGAHDQCANAVGCGVIREGSAVYGMGTVICITPVFAKRRESAMMIERGLNTEHHAAPGLFASFIYNQSGCLVKWFRDTFAAADKARAAAEGADVYEALMAELPEGPASTMALPYFTATGPPEFVSGAAGTLAGLRLDTTRGDVLKGLIEGAAFYLKAVVDSLPATGIEVRDYRAAGGGSKSDAWVQICADIMGRPFTRPRVTEAGTLGAAVLAGAAEGLFTLEQGVEALVSLEQRFEPDARRHEQYRERFALYQRLSKANAQVMRELGPRA